MTREAALALQYEWTESESLRKHMLAVALLLRAYAGKLGGDPDLWEVVGLLHDFDYERHPSLEEHPVVGVAELRRRGVDEVICRAILSHNDLTGPPRETVLEHALFACDELSGFLVPCALVRPERLEGLAPKSVRKKMKMSAFAAAVSREDLLRGAEELGVPFDDHVDFCIAALQPHAAELGLVAP